MRIPKTLNVILGLLVFLATGCSTNNGQGRAFRLPSGRVVRITGIGPMQYTNGNPPSLMLRYQTDLKISDKDALHREADEVWSVLRVDADRSNYTSAIVSAVEIPHGLIFKKASGFNFVYDKSPDGSWHSSNGARTK